MIEKNQFLANLGKLKNTEYKKVVVGIDVPRAILPSFHDLDNFNYNFRNENQNARTRFGLRNDGLILLGKLDGETKFKIIKEIKCVD